MSELSPPLFQIRTVEQLLKINARKSIPDIILDPVCVGQEIWELFIQVFANLRPSWVYSISMLAFHLSFIT